VYPPLKLGEVNPTRMIYVNRVKKLFELRFARCHVEALQRCAQLG